MPIRYSGYGDHADPAGDPAGVRHRGAVIGLINGIVIAYLNVTPFITTLGTMIIVYGINSLYYDSRGRVADLRLRQPLLPFRAGVCGAGLLPPVLHYLLRADCRLLCLDPVEQDALWQKHFRYRR